MTPVYEYESNTWGPAEANRIMERDGGERISPEQVRFTELVGEKIKARITHAPGNGAPIGGIKVIADNGWFAAHPSGTENIYKIYAENFRGEDHLRLILEEA